MLPPDNYDDTYSVVAAAVVAAAAVERAKQRTLCNPRSQLCSLLLPKVLSSTNTTVFSDLS